MHLQPQHKCHLCCKQPNHHPHTTKITHTFTQHTGLVNTCLQAHARTNKLESHFLANNAANQTNTNEEFTRTCEHSHHSQAHKHTGTNTCMQSCQRRGQHTCMHKHVSATRKHKQMHTKTLHAALDLQMVRAKRARCIHSHASIPHRAQAHTHATNKLPSLIVWRVDAPMFVINALQSTAELCKTLALV